MDTVTSQDGTTIAYDKLGAGPALILVHPAGGFRGSGMFESLAEHLAAQFTVYHYDRRGRGDSTETLPYAVEREVEDLQAMIDAAGGSAFVYGFSSGAILALQGAARGLTIQKLALLEPPLASGEYPPADSKLPDEIADLVAAGRRGDAVEHFQRGIGVPEAMTAGQRQAPFWPTMEAMAHTLVYDLRISASLPIERLAEIPTPTLVIDSEASDARLRSWAKGVADALPNGVYRTLKGEWHSVYGELLIGALVEFFTEPIETSETMTGLKHSG